MHRNYAVAAGTPTAEPESFPELGRATPFVPRILDRRLVLSAVAFGVGLQLALAQPSLADYDSRIRMVLATDPADPFSLSPQLAASADLSAAIDALFADVPEEEWKKLPADFAASVDATLYARDT